MATASLAAASFAIPTSSIVSATSAAPNSRASAAILSNLPSPSSRLIELMIGRPPITFSAASSTSSWVVSIMIGIDTAGTIRRSASVMSRTSSRPT